MGDTPPSPPPGVMRVWYLHSLENGPEQGPGCRALQCVWSSCLKSYRGAPKGGPLHVLGSPQMWPLLLCSEQRSWDDALHPNGLGWGSRASAGPTCLPEAQGRPVLLVRRPHFTLELGHFLFKRSQKGQAGTPLETSQSGVCEWGFSFGWEGAAEGGKEKRQLSQGANPKQPGTTPGPQPSETRPFTSQFKLRGAPSPAPLPLPEPQGNRATPPPPLKSQLRPPPAGGDPEVTLGLPLHPGARPSI